MEMSEVILIKKVMKGLDNLFTEDEQKVLLFFFSMLFLGILLNVNSQEVVAKDADSLQVVIEKDIEVKYDLRIVTKEDLMRIRGIGEKKAEDILSYRNIHGFNTREDLLNVKGIGQATFLKIKENFVEFGIPVIKNDTLKLAYEREVTEIKVIKINVNTATYDDLLKVKGIGPVKAKEIISLREKKGKFSNLIELKEVKGIGDKTVEKISEFLTTGDNDGNDN